MSFRSILVIVLFILFATISGVHVYGQEPETSIKMCIKNSGAVFMIGDGFKVADCRKNEKLISLNFGARGAPGPQGPVGEKGDKGDQGDPGIAGTQGENGVSGWEKVSAISAENDDNEKSVTATCPEGKKVISGGYEVTNIEGTSRLYYAPANYPSSDTQWTAKIYKSTDTLWTLTVYAICAVTH